MGTGCEFGFDAFAQLLADAEERHAHPFGTAVEARGEFVVRAAAAIALIHEPAHILRQLRETFLEEDRLVALRGALRVLRERDELHLLEAREIHLLARKSEQFLADEIPC